MKILITGASGFIGRSLSPYLSELGHDIETLSFRQESDLDDIDLHHIDAIIHLAALVHQMNGAPVEQYFHCNYDLTKVLADKLIQQNPKAHFIFISTVKVYGESFSDQVLDENTACYPEDPYGESKRKAEDYLLSRDESELRVSILRLPLVYGPGVKGNFISLINMHTKSPLIPFKNVDTKRSMVFVGNVCALIGQILSYHGKRKIFLAADRVDAVPLGDLSELLLQGLQRNRKVLFLPFPKMLRRLLKRVKPNMHERLFDNFAVNASATFEALDYTPKYTVEKAVSETCQWYLSQS